jgi:hypothetical protein
MILDLHKLENVKHAGNGCIVARCPACAAEGHDSAGNHLKVYASGKYGCVTHKEDKEHTKTIFKLAGKNGQSLDGEEKPQEMPKIEIERVYPKDLLKLLVKDHSYWMGRGIKESTIEEFQGGVAITEGALKGRYVVPIFNQMGEIHGWSGRWLAPESERPKKVPKYKHWPHTSKFVYPLHLNKQDILKKRKVILVEGQGDLLALFNSGIRYSLQLFGTNISSALMGALVVLNPDEIHIATNNEPGNDNIGNDAAEKIKNRLLSVFDESSVKISLPPKKDFGEMSNEEIWAWHNEFVK